MASINTLRALLVGGAFVAGVVAAIYGLWLTATIMAAAVVVHGVLTVRLRRQAGPASHPFPPGGAPVTSDPA